MGPLLFYIATLGSILDSQLSWESGKLQLARWSHRVVIFLVRTDPTRRVSLKSPISQLLLIRCSMEELLDHFKHITTLLRTFVHATFVQVMIVIPWKVLIYQLLMMKFWPNCEGLGWCQYFNGKVYGPY